MRARFLPAILFRTRTEPATRENSFMRELSMWRMRGVIPAGGVGASLFSATDLGGRSARRRRPSTPLTTPTATPISEPLIISRADEFPDENPQAIPPDPNADKPVAGADTTRVQTLEDLGNRIKKLEAGRKPDADEKQKRLLLN